MFLIEQLEVLERLHLLIKRKGTGTPKALAQKLKISKRQLYRYLSILKSQDAVIKYCKDRESYYYIDFPKSMVLFKQ